jgi:hypothetical protein
MNELIESLARLAICGAVYALMIGVIVLAHVAHLSNAIRVTVAAVAAGAWALTMWWAYPS